MTLHDSRARQSTSALTDPPAASRGRCATSRFRRSVPAGRALAVVAVALATGLGAHGCKRDADRDKRPEPTYKGPKVTLEIKFTPGEYRLTEEVNIDTTITAEGESMETSQSTLVHSDVTIAEPKPSGEQEITTICRRIKQSVTVGKRKTEYDSAAPAAGQDRSLRRALSPLIGWRGVLTVDANGKFIKLDGLESLLAAIEANSSSSQMSRQLRKQFQSFFQEMLTKHWGKLIPTKPVGPGDEWTKQIKVDFVPMLGDMKFDCDAWLEDIKKTDEGQVALINFRVETTMRDKKIDALPGASATIERLSIDLVGTAHFNMDIGLCAKLDVRLSGGGSISVQARGKSQTAKLRLDGRIHNRLKRLPGTLRPPRRPAATQTAPATQPAREAPGARAG